MNMLFYYKIDSKEYNIEFNFKENSENLLKIDKYEDDYYLNKLKSRDNLKKYDKKQYIKFYNFLNFCIINNIDVELGF